MIKEYERQNVYYLWGMSLTGLIYSLLSYHFGFANPRPYNTLIIDIIFFTLLLIDASIKLILINKGFFSTEKRQMTMRIVELTILMLGDVFVTAFFVPFSITFMYVIIISAYIGRKKLLRIIFIYIILHAGLRFIIETLPLGGGIELKYHMYDVFLYGGIIALIILSGGFFKSLNKSSGENARLVKELEDKYEQLNLAQEETKRHFAKLKETNIKLEETNKKLVTSVAESFTLQQISNAIASIFDTNELLKFVNDIIIGVMGTNNSSIILYDDEKDKLKVQVTTINDRKELAILNDNINCQLLKDVLQNGKPLVENFIDQDEYQFTKGREISSLMCIPLSTKSQKIGLVIIENKFNNTFDENNVRLMAIISQQVGIAMENAILYQKMRDMATTDSLTKIYNRLYFQDRLHHELLEAQKGDYPLSLSIFDIDHFKKFNDTYGHLFGDKVLIKIASLVNSMLRSTDIFARFGGEEFVILFPRMNAEDAYKKLERIREKIATTLIKDQIIEASVTVSFGISEFPMTSLTEKELISNADDALYRAKNTGRNKVIIYNSNACEISKD